jgi:hypothetical protein
LLRRTLSDQASFLQRNKPVSRPYGLLQIMKCHDDSVAIFPVQVFQSFSHLAMLAEVEVRSNDHDSHSCQPAPVEPPMIPGGAAGIGSRE